MNKLLRSIAVIVPVFLGICLYFTFSSHTVSAASTYHYCYTPSPWLIDVETNGSCGDPQATHFAYVSGSTYQFIIIPGGNQTLSVNSKDPSHGFLGSTTVTFDNPSVLAQAFPPYKYCYSGSNQALSIITNGDCANPRDPQYILSSPSAGQTTYDFIKTPGGDKTITVTGADPTHGTLDGATITIDSSDAFSQAISAAASNPQNPGPNATNPTDTSTVKCTDGTAVPTGQSAVEVCQNHGGVFNSLDEFKCNNGEKLFDCLKRNPIVKDINVVIDFLGALAGIIVVIMVIMGGIQFSTSSGDPQAVAKARSRIANALLALVGFGLLWAFLNFVIPGGLF